MILQPNYYDDFKCIANKCKDNCCIGWEIDIDEATFNKYMLVKGELGNRLKNEIATENEVHYFKLKEHDRCPFLNRDNLCDIICEMGENGLCQICNDHPRYFNNYGDITEKGLGLACEEACRIILTQSTPSYMVNNTTKIKFTPDKLEDIYLEYLYKIRDIIIDTLQSKDYNLTVRLACVIELCIYVQKECSSDKSDIELLNSINSVKEYVNNLLENISNYSPKANAEEKNNLIKQILMDYTQLEILDNSWEILLNKTISNIKKQHNKSTSNNYSCTSDLIYENMLVYLTHRYFLEGYYDNMLIEKSLLLLSTYIVIKSIYDYSFKEQNINSLIDIIHSYSKEIEYSDINIETLYQKYCTNTAYTENNVYTLLSE